MLSEYLRDEDVTENPVRLWQLPEARYPTIQPTKERRDGWSQARFNPKAHGLPPENARDYWWRVGLHDLTAKLSKCAGWAMVATNITTLPYMITEGFLLDGEDAVMEIGAPSACHDNASRLTRLNSEKMVLMTGYALSDDGMWRSHSWCLSSEDDGSFTIIETTVPRLAYFGHIVRRNQTPGAFPELFNHKSSPEEVHQRFKRDTCILKNYYQEHESDM
jgi:hypothetical protein